MTGIPKYSINKMLCVLLDIISSYVQGIEICKLYLNLLSKVMQKYL